MTLSELSYEQKIALVALMKAVAMANAKVSDGEARGIAGVADALGDETYRTLLDEAESRFESVDALKEFLGKITDTAARELIYGTVWDESMADPDIQHSESELLQWLAKSWEIAP